MIEFIASYNKSQGGALFLVYFDKEVYLFRTHLLSIIRSLNTVYTAIGICHATYVDCLLARQMASRMQIERKTWYITFIKQEVWESPDCDENRVMRDWDVLQNLLPRDPKEMA